MFTPYLGILPPVQREIWPRLHPVVQEGFVLYGGTAIALRIGHRQSVDFDFFTDHPLDKDRIFSRFSFLDQGTVIQDEPETLSVSVPGNGEWVKISFFGGIHFGRVGLPESTKDDVLLVASFDDLMATKVKTILQRISAKDYQDIAAMLLAGVSLSRGLGAARILFGRHFSPNESLKALTYFKGGDLDVLDQKTRNILVQAAKEVDAIEDVQILSNSLGV
jgi:hypothetical protein